MKLKFYAKINPFKKNFISKLFFIPTFRNSFDVVER